MNEKLYLKFGKTGEYFEIEAESFEPITAEPIDENNPVLRKKWGEVIIKNKPYKYRTNAVSANNLYSDIMGLAPTTYIFIKHTGNDTDITEGYFGITDCEIDSTTKHNIKITPEIFDQYTPLIEYWDTKVNPYANMNLVKNPNFDRWSDDLPSDWEYTDIEGFISPERLFLLEKNAVKLKARGIYRPVETGWDFTTFEGFHVKREDVGCKIYQTTRKAKAGRQIKISFDYHLMRLHNPKNVPSFLSYRISYLDKYGIRIFAEPDGSWPQGSVYLPLNYIPIDNNAYPYPNDDINSYKKHQIILDPLTEDVELKIEFSHSVPFSANYDSEVASMYLPELLPYYESDLILTNIKVESSNVTYKSIDISLSTDDFVEKGTGEIYDERDYTFPDIFTAKISKTDVENYEEGGRNILWFYFDQETNEPKLDLMDSTDFGFWGHGDSGIDWTPKKLQDNFDKNNNKNTGFFQGEICKVELFELRRWEWNGIKRYQRMRGRFWFAREEKVSDERWTQIDFDNGLITDTSQIGTYKPPEQDVGWVSTYEDEKLGGMLWVRKPYNGEVGEWQITDYEGGVRGSEEYVNRIIAEKIYPQGENSIIVTTAVELKDIVRNVYNGTNEELSDKEVYSTFLWNDLPADTLTTRLLAKNPLLAQYNSINYYTNEENQLKNIVALHTYDLKTERSNNDSDSLFEISFKDMIDDFAIIFPNLYFFVDEDKNLHLEHLSYEDYTQGISDIRGDSINCQIWKYNKNIMFAITDYSMINAGYRDFDFTSLSFDKIVSNRRRIDLRESFATKNITTDIRYCIENPNDIDNGLILLNYEPTEIEGENVRVRRDRGVISGNVIVNGYISLANMLEKFGNFEGVWKEGQINNKNRRFKHTKWIKDGLETIEISGINQSRYFYNELGIGKPRTVTYDYRQGITKLELRYRELEKVIIVADNNLLKL